MLGTSAAPPNGTASDFQAAAALSMAGLPTVCGPVSLARERGRAYLGCIAAVAAFTRVRGYQWLRYRDGWLPGL